MYVGKDIEFTQPPENNFIAKFFTNVQPVIHLVCALDAIPSGVTVTWLQSNRVVTTLPNEVMQTDKTNMLMIRNPQLSDSGIYQCMFNNNSNGWLLRRNIILGLYNM